LCARTLVDFWDKRLGCTGYDDAKNNHVQKLQFYILATQCLVGLVECLHASESENLLDAKKNERRFRALCACLEFGS
jgi:hypothetical protein